MVVAWAVSRKTPIYFMIFNRGGDILNWGSISMEVEMFLIRGLISKEAVDIF